MSLPDIRPAKFIFSVIVRIIFKNLNLMMSPPCLSASNISFLYGIAFYVTLTYGLKIESTSYTEKHLLPFSFVSCGSPQSSTALINAVLVMSWANLLDEASGSVCSPLKHVLLVIWKSPGPLRPTSSQHLPKVKIKYPSVLVRELYS